MTTTNNTTASQPQAKHKGNTSCGGPRRGYPPCSLEAFAALREFLKQARTRTTPPDLRLLTVDPHGPFRKITVNNKTSPTPISFGFRNETLKLRNFPAPDALLLRLLLAFGGGCSVNDDGKGWASPRLFGGQEGIRWDRLPADAGHLEVVQHRAPDGRRNDHHDVDPDYRCIETIPAVATATVTDDDGGDVPRKRQPKRGRPEAIASALTRYRANHHRSTIDITESGYLQLLNDAFALVDDHRRNGLPA